MLPPGAGKRSETVSYAGPVQFDVAEVGIWSESDGNAVVAFEGIVQNGCA
jgi:hypothetical protein